MTASHRGARPAPSRRRLDVVVVGIVTVVAVVLLYARLPFAAQQFWAEDGREFFGDALRLGPIKAFGHSEAGYYLTVPRVGGAIASMVPLRDAASAMWWFVAVVDAWMVATVAVSSRTWLRTWPSRIVVALAIVLLPTLGQESIGNAANLQFALVFASLVVLVSEPRSRLEVGSGCAMVVATGLTTPLAVGLVPFVAFRMVRRRSWRPDAVVVAWLVGVAVQWIAIAVTRPEQRARSGETWADLVPRLELFGVERNLSPAVFEGYRGPYFSLLFAGLVVIVAGLAWWQRRRARAALLVAVPLFGVGAFLALGVESGGANRYLVLAGLCLVWTAMAGAETVGDVLARVVPEGRVVVSVLVASWLLLSFAVHRTPSDLRRSGSTWHESLDAAREECASRPGGSVRIRTSPLQPDKPDQWSVVVSCADFG